MTITEIVSETFLEGGPHIIVTQGSTFLKRTHFYELKQKICLTGCESCKNSCHCVSHRYLRNRGLR